MFKYAAILCCLIIVAISMPIFASAQQIQQKDINALLQTGYHIESSLPANYVKNGSVDYTSYIQSALDKNSNVIFPAFPILINDTGLTLHDNQKVYFTKGAVLLLSPSAQPNYQMLRIHDISHVLLVNPTLKGDKFSHLNKSGEWGMGISIKGASDVCILSGKIEECWGDAIYIGYTPTHTYSDNVTIKNIICNNNRRNGISVISAKNLTLQAPVVTNTSGTEPMCGIDIEPNSNVNTIDNINITDAVTKNNQYGISFYLSPLNGAIARQTNIVISNHHDTASKYALQFGSRGSNIKGKVAVSGSVWADNNDDPIKIVGYEPQNGVQVLFNNTAITKKVNGVKQDVGARVMSAIKRNLRPGDVGLQLNNNRN